MSVLVEEYSGVVLGVDEGDRISHYTVKVGYGDIKTFYRFGGRRADIKPLDYLSVSVSDNILIGNPKRMSMPDDVGYLLSTDIQTQTKINDIEFAILSGEQPEKVVPGVEKVIKKAETKITLAAKNTINERHRHGKTIITYSSVPSDSSIKTPNIDVWTDKLGSVDSDRFGSMSEEEKKELLSQVTLDESKEHVVLSNGDVLYPDDYDIPELRGKPVKGFYQENGEFVIDQENGTDTLQDEYISNVSYVKDVYQIDPTISEQTAYKAFPAYAFVPSNPVVLGGNKKWEYGGDISDRIVISTKKGGMIAGSSVVRPQAYSESYKNWDEYMSELKSKAGISSVLSKTKSEDVGAVPQANKVI